MNNRQRFILVFSVAQMTAFVALTSLDVKDLGIIASSYAVIYIVLRLVLSPRLRTKVDILGLLLLGTLTVVIAQHVIVLLGVG